MRLGVFALLLCAGPAVFGQSAPAAPFNPDNLGKMPSPWTERDRDFGKLPPGWSPTKDGTVRTLILPAPERAARVQIDPQCILHPSQQNLGTQPPGKLVAQNLYPGLTFLPIGSQAAGTPLSTVWPKLKTENLPIIWQDLKVAPAGESGTPIAH